MSHVIEQNWVVTYQYMIDWTISYYLIINQISYSWSARQALDVPFNVACFAVPSIFLKDKRLGVVSRTHWNSCALTDAHQRIFVSNRDERLTKSMNLSYAILKMCNQAPPHKSNTSMDGKAEWSIMNLWTILL